MSIRIARATIGSLKRAIANIPDDYAISTNYVGNLTVLDRGGEMAGYIELANPEIVADASKFECEYTDREEWSATAENIGGQNNE